MPRKKRIGRRELRRREKIRRGVRRYWNDIRAIAKATARSVSQARSNTPRSVRVDRKGHRIPRAHQIEAAKARIQRQQEPPREKTGPKEPEAQKLSLINSEKGGSLYEFLALMARKGHKLEIVLPFYQATQEPGAPSAEADAAFHAKEIRRTLYAKVAPLLKDKDTYERFKYWFQEPWFQATWNDTLKETVILWVGPDEVA